MRDALSRRTVVLGAGAVVVAAAGGLLAWRSLADAHATIRAMIASHMRGATMAEGAVDAFVADFLRVHRVRRDGVVIDNACDALGLDDVLQACASNAEYLRRVEEQVIDLFGRSTDMFDAGRRAGEPVRYVALWDPYAAACRNPFAEFT